MIYIIGLGNKNGEISLSAHKKLESCKKILTKSNLVSTFQYFVENNLQVENLDRFFENSRNFENCYKKIATYVKKCEKEFGEVAYCVEGSGLDDESAKLLSKNKNVQIFCSSAKAFSILPPNQSYCSFSATDFLTDTYFELPNICTVICEIDSFEVASQLKLKLAQMLGDETKIDFFDGNKKSIFVYELDRQNKYDYSVCICIYPQEFIQKKRFSFCDLVNIVKILRSPNGCPWDKAQTYQSLRTNILEESMEVIEAIEQNNYTMLEEELGDLMLQPVFLSNIAEGENAFSFFDVFTTLCTKLVFRHSFIFGKDKVENCDEALTAWDKNKSIEKHLGGLQEELSAIPKTLPSLMYATKVLKKFKKYNVKKYDDFEINKELDQITFDKEQIFYALMYLCKLAKDKNVDLEIEFSQWLKQIN